LYDILSATFGCLHSDLFVLRDCLQFRAAPQYHQSGECGGNGYQYDQQVQVNIYLQRVKTARLGMRDLDSSGGFAIIAFITQPQIKCEN